MIAAVLVTHNSERWIRATLESIANQTRKADHVVVIDDNSTDGTKTILAEFGIAPIGASTTSTDVTTRVAQNFQQGIRETADADIVILGDHDDIWHPRRIERQSTLLETTELANTSTLMVASDGNLVDESGVATGGTLRTTFPVADDWNALPANAQLAFALRHSLATGGASAIRPSYFAQQEIPAGWLHDRWWSLLATVRLGMLIDSQSVIDYRVHGTQQVGLDTGHQGLSSAGKVKARSASLRTSMRKAKDLSTSLRAQCATPSLHAQLTMPKLVKAGLS